MLVGGNRLQTVSFECVQIGVHGKLHEPFIHNLFISMHGMRVEIIDKIALSLCSRTARGLIPAKVSVLHLQHSFRALGAEVHVPFFLQMRNEPECEWRSIPPSNSSKPPHSAHARQTGTFSRVAR